MKYAITPRTHSHEVRRIGGGLDPSRVKVHDSHADRCVALHTAHTVHDAYARMRHRTRRAQTLLARRIRASDVSTLSAGLLED